MDVSGKWASSLGSEQLVTQTAYRAADANTLAKCRQAIRSSREALERSGDSDNDCPPTSRDSISAPMAISSRWGAWFYQGPEGDKLV